MKISEYTTQILDDINSIKTSQSIGGDSTLCYVDKNIFTLPATSKGGEYYLIYEAESDFPLVSYSFKVFEGGVYKPNPRSLMGANEGKDSAQFYTLYYNAYRYTVMPIYKPSVRLENPNIDSRILQIGGYGGTVASVDIRIEIEARANCRGLIKIEPELLY